MSTEPTDIAENITTLRGHLFSTLRGLTDKANPMDIDRAHAVTDVAQTIINTAKVEIEQMKLTGGSGSGFIPANAVTGLKHTALTQTGMKTVQTVPGGTVTSHRLAG